MTTKEAESSQPEVETGRSPAPHPPGPPDVCSRVGNTIFKSGSLFISSKGIGWTSWKKRWFILTRTSLVFFRSDPKGSEVNLTLGGIDLNNSGSVVVKADKKLLTVLFSDGRDGRAFTLKAENMEDLYEWKAALENALAQAPSAAQVIGQNGILRNDESRAANKSNEKMEDKAPAKSHVLGTPILLALEDVDGHPSFLEKALRFVEEHGVKVEGILRQAADVEDVERRIREFEQGKIEFSPGEDAHVIADCVKYVLRELPSSPVPASCCNALLEACRADRVNRANAMRAAICETFPEPNRRLLQRVLMMMQRVASQKAVNRMSTSAVAACMAPLLLRPLLAGDCEIDNDFDVGGDGSSLQLLQAAAAANHAQAIVITLLEEYDDIFGEGSASPDLYSDTDESGSESEEATADDESCVDEDDDATEGSEMYTDDGSDNSSIEACDESFSSVDNDPTDNKSINSEEKGPDDYKLDDNKASEAGSLETKSAPESSALQVRKKFSSSLRRASLPRHEGVDRRETTSNNGTHNADMQDRGECVAEMSMENKPTISGPPASGQKSFTGCSKRCWGRTSAKKNLSMESIEYPLEEEDDEVQRLEATKSELQNRIAEEVKSNAVLQASLENRKKALHERRVALEKDVHRLQEQLQKERDTREALEAGLHISDQPFSIPASLDEEVKLGLHDIAQAEVDITKLEQKVDNLEDRINQQHAKCASLTYDTSNKPRHMSDSHANSKDYMKDTEASSASCSIERSTNENIHWDKRESEAEKQNESTPWGRYSWRSQQADQARSSSLKSASSHTSRRTARGEGMGSTTSAVSKLTTRLNFLKDRRSQAISELQSTERGRISNHSGPNSEKAQDTEQGHGGGKGSEGHSSASAKRSENSVSHNSEKEQGSGSTQRTLSR